MLRFIAAVIALVGLSFSCEVNCRGDPVIDLSTGAFYTSGEYESGTVVEEVYVPFSVRYASGDLAYKITIPYVDAYSANTLNESGLGDVLLSLTVYDVFASYSHGVYIDLTGKAKLPTADSESSLGTGEPDYSLRGDIYKFFKSATVFASCGYRVRGDPDDIDLQNVWYFSSGWASYLAQDVLGGIEYAYRESSLPEFDAAQEISAFLSLRLSRRWKIQFFALKGLSNASPDWGGGIILKTRIDQE